MQECDLILETLGAERDVLDTLKLLFERSRDYLARHPVEGLISMLVESQAVVAVRALTLKLLLCETGLAWAL